MKMKAYLNLTGDSVSPMFRVIQESLEKIFHLDIDIHHLVHLENYLLGKEHNGWGPRNHDRFEKEYGEPPTIAAAQRWQEELTSWRDARNETINIMCGSILMIAQAGIKRVLGAPSSWRGLEGNIMSSQHECVLKAIWHGRNLAAHVEGLSAGTPSYKYFEDLKNRKGIDLLAPTTKFSCIYVVRDMLGWIDIGRLPVEDTVHTDQWPSPYVQDMERIGQLALT
jgi:hypothetical protein